MFINVGATLDWQPIPTKKALREAIVNNPTALDFYGTSAFGTPFSGGLEFIPEGVTLSVVGPDPYESRKWYASVSRVRGQIKFF